MTLPTLHDIRASLLSDIDRADTAPCHVKAFRAWVMNQEGPLEEAINDAVLFIRLRRPIPNISQQLDLELPLEC